MNNRAIRALATVWAHSPGRSASNARMLARLGATSKEYRRLVGDPMSVRNERARKERVKKILARRAYLIRKFERGRPLNPEERAFLEYYNIGRWRGEAYIKGLAPRPLSRQPAAMRYNENPIGPHYRSHMYRMIRWPAPGPGALYGTVPINVSPTNRYRTTGKRTGTVASFRKGSSVRPVNIRWRKAIQLALNKKRHMH